MTGKALFDKILVALNLALVLGTVGVFVYTNIIDQRPLVDEALEEQRLQTQAAEKIRPNSYKLDKLIINLNSETRRLRFLDIEINLETFRPEQVSYLETKKARILDQIIDIAGRMRPDELNSLAGKILLEDRLKKALNTGLVRPAVKKVLFTHFVIQ